MSLSFEIPDSVTLLSHMGLWAMRATVLAFCAGLGLTALRQESTSLRLFTWTAVLYGAFAIPLLGWLLPSLNVPLPGRFQSASISGAQHSEPSMLRSAAGTETSTSASPEPSSENVFQNIPVNTPSREAFHIQWTEIAAAFYLAIALLLLARFAVGFTLARRLVQAAQPIGDPRVTSKINSWAHRYKVHFVPEACESASILVPVTIGVLRSTILMPADWNDWDDEKLDAIIAHEMSHVARRDALTQSVSLLHRAIFWFSPLSWWLNRHLANLAEQASDEAALSGGADRTRYARTLLGFFETLHAVPGRVWWQGVSMANAGPAEKRLQRILGWRGAFNMGMKKSAIVAIIALAVPVVYLTAAACPSNDGQSSTNAAKPQAPQPAAAEVGQSDAPAAPARPAPADPSAGEVSTSGTAPVAPIAPMASSVSAAPMPSVVLDEARSSESGSSGRFSYAYGFDDEQRFVIVSGKSDSFTMSGSSEDARHVQKLRKQIPGDFIWFQRDEKSYIIRDQATIDQARKLWLPQEELGKKQEALGKQQEILGKQQSELGTKMEQVRVNVPDMTATLDRLKAKLQKLGPSATMDQIGELQSEIGELQSKIGQIQSQAGDQQSKLGEEQGALGAKQGELGRQQGELGRQQGELARKATVQMKQILDEAIKNGTAKPEPETPDSGSL